MIAIITMQSVAGDCPSNITVDVDKLKALTMDDCKAYIDKELSRWTEGDKISEAEEDKISEAEEYMEDAIKYVNIIEGKDSENPDGWEVLEMVKVELPQQVDYTDVIFYGSY